MQDYQYSFVCLEGEKKKKKKKKNGMSYTNILLVFGLTSNVFYSSQCLFFSSIIRRKVDVRLPIITS